MSHYQCQADHCAAPTRDIPAGQAVLRSDLHSKRAYHGHCLDLARAAVELTPAALPAQRGGSLSERLARVAS